MTNTVDWWNIIAKLRYDKSYWHHLEPAEIMEIVQQIKEGKEKIWGLDKFIQVELKPALNKLNRMKAHLHIRNIHNSNIYKLSPAGRHTDF